jgi:hypothetical protein
VQGRWVSPDPAGLDAADFANPQSWNRYVYVLNNPLMNMDLTGLFCAYLNDSGNGVENIDSNSGEGECASNGGYWLQGDYGGGSWVNANSDNGTVTGLGYDSSGNAEISIAGAMGSNDWGAWTQTFSGGPDPSAANNQSFWGYITSKPWVVSWILPLAGPVPGVVGVGPAGGVAWNPKTHNLCVGFGLGASAGHNAAIGPLLTSSGNVDSILSGWSVSGGGNLPFPLPAAGLGWQVIANSSGVAQGPTAGVAGLSGSVTWSACANL